ncbi:MAG: ROK family protein, partial [Clostridia bacterium]|nr:ROK family protein [Clostridia bacterium]
MVYIGVDVGGMSIKIGIVNSEGKILLTKAFATEQEKGFKSMFARTADMIKELLAEGGFSLIDLGGIGIGIPGTVDSKKGMIISAVNIGCKNERLVEEMSQYFNVPIAVGNDANMAALGEQRFGAGKGHENVVMVTLGTGIGGGIIIDGKLYEGNGGAGGEVGHQIICIDGEQCNCSRRGCWEKYASATGLINQAEQAMAEKA